MFLNVLKYHFQKKLQKKIKIPNIGIGASAYCDGQILVTDDLIGLNLINARFVKKYAKIDKVIGNAVLRFKKDVKKNIFPIKNQSY